MAGAPHHRHRRRRHDHRRRTPVCCRRNSGCSSPNCSSAVTIPGRAPLTDAEWRAFAAEIVTPNFPDGFTATDGDGQWQNPATHEISRQRTKILLVAVKRAPDLEPRLAAVIDAYKARFHQQSVGVITRDS